MIKIKIESKKKDEKFYLKEAAPKLIGAEVPAKCSRYKEANFF
jgi:hypothetical protein